MVFKRRDPRPWWKIVFEFFWPRGGWGRAAQYVKHRLQRLPDSPEKIARGIFAGVFTAFTPFYGLHFFIAALLAVIMRGNVLAGLLGTFFGNPLTYVPIAMVSLETGYFMVGRDLHASRDFEDSLGYRFLDAASDLRDNFIALFTDQQMDWHRLGAFYDDVFFPYMVGGIVPGIVAAVVCYYVSVPILRAYQNRRKARLLAKSAKLAEKADFKADDPEKPD